MEIDRRADLDPETFAAEYARPNRPVVLANLGGGWPARQRWTFDALRARGLGVEVLVEQGDAVIDNAPRQRMTLAGYIDAVLGGQATEQRLYLAGLDLFKLFPDLRDDVDFSILGRKKLWYRRAWIGAAGTGSGFHRDVGDNVLAQVIGEKTVRLVAPAQRDLMYESRRFDFLTYVSEVDVDHWDRARHPAFAGADIGEVLLGPGDALFIPTNWWHATASRTHSVSVNCGGMTFPEAARAWRHFAEYGAHLAHLYRRGDCLCHPHVATAKELQPE